MRRFRLLARWLGITLVVGAAVWYFVTWNANAVALEEYRYGLARAGQPRSEGKWVTLILSDIRAREAAERLRAVIETRRAAILSAYAAVAGVVLLGLSFRATNTGVGLAPIKKSSGGVTPESSYAGPVSDSLRRHFLWSFWVGVIYNFVSVPFAAILAADPTFDGRLGEAILGVLLTFLVALLPLGWLVWALWATWRLTTRLGFNRWKISFMILCLFGPIVSLGVLHHIGTKSQERWGDIGSWKEAPHTETAGA